jgi:hypothetical protein
VGPSQVLNDPILFDLAELKKKVPKTAITTLPTRTKATTTTTTTKQLNQPSRKVLQFLDRLDLLIRLPAKKRLKNDCERRRQKKNRNPKKKMGNTKANGKLFLQT